MRIYLVYNRSYASILREEKVPILLNYAYLTKEKPFAEANIPRGFSDCLIDSGGYQLQVGVTASRKPDVHAYSYWLRVKVLPKRKEIVGYMNLDVMDAEMFTDVHDKSLGERVDSWKKSAELTFKNQQIMENEYKLKPIPIWHAGEPEEQLRFYCQNYDYVAIGGLVFLGTPSKTSILNLLTFIMQKYPNVKFHLFGIGISGLMAFKSLRPYSIDFSTWNVPARFGHDLVEDDKQFLREIRLPDEQREAIRQDNDLEANYLRETVRKIKMLQEELEKYNDPYQRLLL